MPQTTYCENCNRDLLIGDRCAPVALCVKCWDMLPRVVRVFLHLHSAMYVPVKKRPKYLDEILDLPVAYRVESKT